MRAFLLVLGCLLVVFQNRIYQVEYPSQFLLFLSGIVILGIPHGAADLLVANRNASSSAKPFSTWKFLVNYISRLVIFAILIWLWPLLGVSIFILIAAYHFGETDLHHFRTDTWIGKLVVVTYGLLILSIILVHHFDEVKPLVQLITDNTIVNSDMSWIDENRYYIVSAAGVIFFTMSFLYFLLNRNNENVIQGDFLFQLAILLIILFNLPMLLGFTFYFVVWHSLLSLKNIVSYLRKEKYTSTQSIAKQLIFYSAISLFGIALFGWFGFSYLNDSVIASAIFIGLAVLTAPHMQVMHDMYRSIRASKQ